MGLEYEHGLFIEDLQWRAGWEHVERVHAVLLRWNLASAPPTLHRGGLLDAATTAAPIPANLRLDYPQVVGAPVVGVLGPSLYELDVTLRYLQGIDVVMGVDLHVHASETYAVDIDVPPMNGPVPVEETHGGLACSARYPATWATTPPRTTAPGPFSGVWRAALIFDCGKDLPMLAEECVHPLPARAFVAELEAALGTRLVELGWLC